MVYHFIMKYNFKKIVLSFSSIALITTPIFSVVACGSEAPISAEGVVIDVNDPKSLAQFFHSCSSDGQKGLDKFTQGRIVIADGTVIHLKDTSKEFSVTMTPELINALNLNKNKLNRDFIREAIDKLIDASDLTTGQQDIKDKIFDKLIEGINNEGKADKHHI